MKWLKKNAISKTVLWNLEIYYNTQICLCQTIVRISLLLQLQIYTLMYECNEILQHL